MYISHVRVIIEKYKLHNLYTPITHMGGTHVAVVGVPLHVSNW
jgi:hypothetical protein